LDDASRKILSNGKFGDTTAENSMFSSKSSLTNVDQLMTCIGECISDYSSRFYVERREQEKLADQGYENFWDECWMRQAKVLFE
jgi:hypothetical protein